MKLLFIENRYKTYFYDEICKHLEKEHEIYWIVQNPKFLPQTGDIYSIPFPSKKTKINKDVDLSYILESDRQQHFFNNKATSYFYYYHDKINKIIQRLRPDIVFGESTAFHELLAINICRTLEILYLNPSTCRYPVGRFSFYQYDTLTPFGGSNQILSKEEGYNIIDNIINRDVKPDYMKTVSFSRINSIRDKLKMITSYYSGESYNTPSPWIKFTKERKKRKHIKLWDKVATSSIDKHTFSVLYPLQMQPEANIDVWGRPYRDQFKTILKLYEQRNEGEILYVKPNPKSKYELSEKLINFIKNNPGIIALRHDVSMNAIFDDIDLFVTVTGTIAIECIFANKPVVTLVKTLNNKAANCIYLKNMKLLQEQILKVRNHDFPSLSKEEKLDFLNLLNASSFKGVVSDPYNSTYSVSEKNISDVVKALNNILISKV